jgi:hypothetical protein
MAASPGKRKARARSFTEEPTGLYRPAVVPEAALDEEPAEEPAPEGAVPEAVDEDGETTMPIDTREMEAAAKASRYAPDPAEPPRIVRRQSTGPHGRKIAEPYAEVQVAGTAEVVALPAHNVSQSGVSLAVPDGVALSVVEGAMVMVHLHLGAGVDGAEVQARLPATVAHRRPGRKGVTGGVALRWDTDNPRVAAELDRVLSARRD